MERSVTVHVLHKGTPADGDTRSAFQTVVLTLDLQLDTALTLKTRIGTGGFVSYFGAIPPEGDPMKVWFVAPDCPVVVIALGETFVEGEGSAASGDDLARLLGAGVPISHAVIALSRAYWHTGFHEFSAAATCCKKLVSDMVVQGTEYQSRTEFACMSPALKELHAVGVFNEVSNLLMWPPSLAGETPEYGGDWLVSNRPTMSTEEKAECKKVWGWVQGTATPALEVASKSVVRCFGYHQNPKAATNSRAPPTLVVPFTAFFVAPTLLMCARSCAYSEAHGTYAVSYSFTRNTRAIHGMLRKDTDLFTCTELRTVPEVLLHVIRNVGVKVPEDKIVPNGMACPWSDVMLLRVAPECSNDTYLLPTERPVPDGECVFALGYHACPTEDWVAATFGESGYCVSPSVNMSTTLLNQMWRYDVKCCSYGHVRRQDTGDGTYDHTATLLPSSRGSVLLTIDPNTHTAHFSGMACGRARLHVKETREHIDASSIGDVSRREGFAANVFNTAMSATHISCILLYQNFIGKECAVGLLDTFLRPYRILTDPANLTACHKKMLKDADDANEYGMRLWEGHRLDEALYCYREGARMFSIASIPGQSDYELRLKDALQSNVAAVVVAKMGK